jgi:hypothetical protein
VGYAIESLKLFVLEQRQTYPRCEEEAKSNGGENCAPLLGVVIFGGLTNPTSAGAFR